MTRFSPLTLLLPLASLLLPLAGCGQSTPAPSSSEAALGTATTLELPEGNSPVLTKAVVDAIKPGMSQDKVRGILREGAKDNPAAKTNIDTAAMQGMMNDAKFDVTITQGKRKLTLSFKGNSLVDKSSEGIE
jgi:hypothetical protein